MFEKMSSDQRCGYNPEEFRTNEIFDPVEIVSCNILLNSTRQNLREQCILLVLCIFI